MEKMLDHLIGNESLRKRLSQGVIKEAERFIPKVIVDKWERMFKTLELSISSSK